jgi:hypothetical protein
MLNKNDFFFCRYLIDQRMIGFLICNFFQCQYRRYRVDIDSWSVPLQLLDMLNKNDCRYQLIISFLICDFLCMSISTISFRYQFMIGSLKYLLNKSKWLLFCRYLIDINSWLVFSFVISFSVNIDSWSNSFSVNIDSWSVSTSPYKWNILERYVKH